MHEHERLGLQLLERHGLAGARMSGGNREYDLVAIEGLERDAAMAAGHPDDPELELAAPDLLDDGVRVRHRQRDMHQRMELLELPEDDRQDASTGTGGSADLESALELAFGFLAEVRKQLLLERDEPLRSAVEPETGLGRLDPASRAVEELLADALLQRPDLKAHRRLRHPELIGGLGEAAALDNRTKGRELLRVHKANL